MKKVTIMILVLGFCTLAKASFNIHYPTFTGNSKLETTTAVNSEYNYWFSDGGVDVYSKWTEGTGSHVVLKVVNRNSYKVNFSFDSICWLTLGGSEIKRTEKQSIDLPAYTEREGDGSGLWFYPPDNYSSKNCKFSMKGAKVVRA